MSASAEVKPAGSTAASARPAGSVAAGAAAAKPEKVRVSVGRSAQGGSFIPVMVAVDAGYFANHGLDVDMQLVAPPVANAGLLSGSLDIYEGASSVINAALAGSDILYVAAPVDRNSQTLIGRPGMSTVASLKGKSIATTSAGAFGDLAARWSAKKEGLEIGKDIKLIYHPTPDAALATFEAENADALLDSEPYSTQAISEGNPVIVDYLKENFRVVGPGTAVSRDFFRKNPNTIKAFLMGYLDGLKRTIDDPAYAKQVDGKYSKLEGQLLETDYQSALRIWNKNLVVAPESIQVVLDAMDGPKAKAAKPSDFYDNSLIDAVNKDYGSKIFPNDIK